MHARTPTQKAAVQAIADEKAKDERERRIISLLEETYGRGREKAGGTDSNGGGGDVRDVGEDAGASGV